MAALALSMSTEAQHPRLVASRRVDFHLKRHALSRWKYRQVERFICASDAIRRMLVGDGVPEARTVTVHEGIDVEHVSAAPAADLHGEFWLPHHAPLVGNVAALVPHKGQRHLIEAAALVVQQVPDARFIIAGEGELRPSFERLIKERRLEKHVFLAGFRPDVLSVHKAFDIFVMSSVTEGLGTSVLDAMACSKPVVATTAGGIPETVVDGVTGLLVQPRDHEAMARAVITLLADDNLRQRMGNAGLRRVRDSFSVDRVLEIREKRSLVVLTRSWLGALSIGQSERQESRPAAGVVARAIIEGHRGAVGRKRDAAGDPARRKPVGIDEADDGAQILARRASNTRS